jgi:outer membrane protein assembly factor BamB
MGAFRRQIGRGIAAMAAVSGIALLSGVSVVTPAAAQPSSAAVASGTPGSRLWVRFYTGPGTGSDSATSVAVARSGSAVFVTGSSLRSSGPTIFDYATVGYDAATGARLWARRYTGAGGAGGSAVAVAVDPSGRTVFVTGQSPGPGSGADYVTIAYDAATGSQLWLSRYNGPANGSDTPAALAVSPDGSRVFVTGESQGSQATMGDYATVAYDAATGAQMWASRYNGPASRFDDARSLAVGPHGGTVYVTGASTGIGTHSDYATVAYNTATGAQRWVSRYNGPRRKYDRAVSVVVGRGGHAVYVTGTSGRAFATVAYDAGTGTQLWVRRFTGGASNNNRAFSQAVSPSGGMVYVTGFAINRNSGHMDIATVSYRASTGALLWAKLTSPKADASGDAVAVGPGGHTVYVTGTAFTATATTVAYNAATGSLRWIRRYPGFGNALAISQVTGTVFVTGSTGFRASGEDYLTIAYHG